MKLKSLKYFLPVIFLLASCSQRENFEDTGIGPPITGLFRELSGNISGTLRASNSPYLAIDDIIIDSNSTLIIEPTVKFYFEEGKRLIVNGKLIAQGSKFERISFLPYRNNWAGIKINDAIDQVLLHFVNFENILSTDNQSIGGIEIINSNVSIKNCYFENNIAYHGGAIGIHNGNVELYNSIFNDNQAVSIGGAVYSNQSTIKFINNVFYKNSSYNAGGGVAINSPLDSELQNNIFYKNTSNTIHKHFAYLSSDSTNLVEQFNFFGSPTLDPYFISDFSFRLIAFSPCVDAGNPDPVFNDVNGTRNDQGAYGGPFGNW